MPLRVAHESPPRTAWLPALSLLAILLTVPGPAGAADLTAASSATGGTAPTALTVGGLSAPMDVDTAGTPLLGWQIGAGMQTAYRIQVATSEQALSEPDVWDSGQVTSAACAGSAHRNGVSRVIGIGLSRVIGMAS
jgi:alpha-L-rhamnosidase